MAGEINQEPKHREAEGTLASKRAFLTAIYCRNRITSQSATKRKRGVASLKVRDS